MTTPVPGVRTAPRGPRLDPADRPDPEVVAAQRAAARLAPAQAGARQARLAAAQRKTAAQGGAA